MRSRINKTVIIIAAGALLAIAPAAFAADRTPKTASDHAEVAKEHRKHAMSLEKKAAKLEREAGAVQDAGPTRAMEQKWPAIIVNARERKAQQAVQARRAAQEAHALAERHEKQARSLSASNR